MGRKSTFTAAQKRDAVMGVLTMRKTVSQTCRELGISETTFARWREQAVAGMEAALADKGSRDSREDLLASSCRKPSARSGSWRWRTTCWEKHRGG